MTSLLNQLPPPPLDKTGWPWTEESPHIPETMPDGKPWPKISIVTPSYNQGQFIEETIRSVLLQNYPNLEYIIIDGGSTDNSVEIIKKYEPWLSYWVSEKDKGQADAISRGFEKSTGRILSWINSDDYYLKNAFVTAAKKFMKNPTMELLIGGYIVVKPSNSIIRKYYGFPQTYESLLCTGKQLFGQMACFWTRKAFFDVGGFDRTMQFCFDYDLFLRLTYRRKFYKSNFIMAAYREHDATKSSTIWDTSGLKEKDILQEKHGIKTIPDNIRAKIIRETKKKYELNKRISLIMDILRDCYIFAKKNLIYPSGRFLRK